MLVDTSVLTRTLQPHHSLYALTDRAIERLLGQGRELHIVAQNLIELWVVATRPLEQNVDPCLGASFFGPPEPPVPITRIESQNRGESVSVHGGNQARIVRRFAGAVRPPRTTDSSAAA